MKYVQGHKQKGVSRKGGLSVLMKWVFAGFGLMLLVTAALIAFGLWQSYHFWLRAPADDAEIVQVEVFTGDGLDAVAQRLTEQSIVASSFWFRVYATLDGTARSIQAGSFEVYPGDSYASIIDILINAESEDVAVTIPEGFMLAQIEDRIIATFAISESDWRAVSGVGSSLSSHPFITSSSKPSGVDMEGYFFPDTYRFFVSATAEDIGTRLLDEMQARVEEAGIVVPEGWTMHEVLTLASIIEREVPNPEDMAMISDIFLKRLDIGMMLQSDATVNYITGDNNPTPTLDDLAVESLYNTYQHVGLPPGPIASPGIEAIKAVVNPMPNPYYFYLTSPEGEVIYAENHDQHVQNKAIYLR